MAWKIFDEALKQIRGIKANINWRTIISDVTSDLFNRIEISVKHIFSIMFCDITGEKSNYLFASISCLFWALFCLFWWNILKSFVYFFRGFYFALLLCLITIWFFSWKTLFSFSDEAEQTKRRKQRIPGAFLREFQREFSLNWFRLLKCIFTH